MLDRLDVNDGSRLNSSTNISSEVEVETLVQENGDDVVTADRLDKSIDREVVDIPIIIQWTRREPRPLQRLLEYRKYLVRKKGREYVLGAFVVMIRSVRVSQNFREVMQKPNIWWTLMVKEINMMKTKKVYELVE